MKFGKFDFDEVDYASQGNAVLGIRDSGKTYTATYLAERLLDAGIPFVAFDPIGVWRYLRVGKDGKPGYPVVVAGDDGDLPLTAESAPNIVRAAMQENIPLVIDLYSMQLSKAAWRRIVQESVEILLYKNKAYGLRHIFLEEAAEFVPQRITPGMQQVYGEIEQLGRMGRNASLGFTLINQRAEEVNKAVLENCDTLFLHRQKGRHSLTALSKWLDIADATNRQEVIKSLATLPQGQCWVWQAGSSTPVLVQVPEKNTVHPDAQHPITNASHTVTADVSEFIARLNSSLKKQEKTRAAIKVDRATGPDETHLTYTSSREPELLGQIGVLEKQVSELQKDLGTARSENAELRSRLDAVRTMFEPEFNTLQRVFAEVKANGNGAVNASAYDVWMQKLVGKQRNILQALIERKRLTKVQLAHLVGMAPRSGTFDEYIRVLIRLKLVQWEGEYLVLNEII